VKRVEGTVSALEVKVDEGDRIVNDAVARLDRIERSRAYEEPDTRLLRDISSPAHVARLGALTPSGRANYLERLGRALEGVAGNSEADFEQSASEYLEDITSFEGATGLRLGKQGKRQVENLRVAHKAAHAALEDAQRAMRREKSPARRRASELALLREARTGLALTLAFERARRKYN